MVDSKQGNKEKGSLDDKENKEDLLQEKKRKKSSITEEPGAKIVNETLPDLQAEELIESDSTELLDDFLTFDAHIFTSSSSAASSKKGVKQHSENLVYPQVELGLGTVSDDNVNNESVTERKLTSDKFSTHDREADLSDKIPQDNKRDTIETNPLYSRILSLENELSDLKKMLEDQTGVISGFEVAENKLKQKNNFSLFMGICAIILSVVSAIMHVSEQQDTVLQKKLSQPRPIVVVPEPKKIDNEQTRSGELKTANNHSKTTLILPEDDIFEHNPVGETVKQLKKTEAPVKEWVVNLNSYQQRGETDKKIEQLKQKGISAEVIIVKVKGKRWFRIRVTGFKTLSEAESYAIEIKKTLNEDLAWVSRR